MKNTKTKDTAIEKVLKLPPEEVSKVLIFMAGLEAGHNLNNSCIPLDKANQPA